MVSATSWFIGRAAVVTGVVAGDRRQHRLRKIHRGVVTSHQHVVHEVEPEHGEQEAGSRGDEGLHPAQPVTHPPVGSSSGADPVLDALERVIGELPGGGEAREGSGEMADAVRLGIAERKHVAVQAGTGTGKTLAYLVPAILSERTTVVATATKALQDQLAGKDLPFLQRTSATLRVGAAEGAVQLPLHAAARRVARPRARTRASSPSTAWPSACRAEELLHLVDWAPPPRPAIGAELDVEPSERAWSAVSVSAQECPGARPLPQRRHVLRGGRSPTGPRGRRRRGQPPPLRARPGHGRRAAPRPRAGRDRRGPPAGGHRVGHQRHRGHRRALHRPGPAHPGRHRRRPAARGRRRRRAGSSPRRCARTATSGCAAACPTTWPAPSRWPRAAWSRCSRRPATCPIDAPEDTRTEGRAPGAVRPARSLDDLAGVERVSDDQVVWVEGTDANPVLRVAPLDVSGLLKERLWDKRTAVLTSATLPAQLPARLGVASAQITELDVGSPFDYEAHALLYCAAHLPDPRNPGYVEALTDELGDLIEAAGGRTLALFTSFRVLDEAAAALQLRFGDDLPILTPARPAQGRLLEQFTADEATSLFATMGFWQGVDVPGRVASAWWPSTASRSPAPTSPSSRPAASGPGRRRSALIDLPRAATLLAQGAGRLIRTATDHGVVAVLDPRLAKAGYRWELVNALPPMRRTKERDEARRTLEVDPRPSSRERDPHDPIRPVGVDLRHVYDCGCAARAAAPPPVPEAGGQAGSAHHHPAARHDAAGGGRGGVRRHGRRRRRRRHRRSATCRPPPRRRWSAASPTGSRSSALFRHPLGLPIPHTAIIVERKDQFGETLGEFIQSSFLTGDAVAERVRAGPRRRPGGALAGRCPPTPTGWPATSLGGAVEVVDLLEDEDVHDVLERLRPRAARGGLDRPDGRPGARRRSPRRAATTRWSTRRCGASTATSTSTATSSRTASATSRPGGSRARWRTGSSSACSTALRAVLDDMAHDREHGLRQQLDAADPAVRRRAADLPELRAKGEQLTRDLLERPELRAWIAAAVDRRQDRAPVAVGRPRRRSCAPDRRARSTSGGERLLAEPALIAKIDDAAEAGGALRGRALRRRDQPARGDHHRPLGRRGDQRAPRAAARPRPPVHPHQRHGGRRRSPAWGSTPWPRCSA